MARYRGNQPWKPAPAKTESGGGAEKKRKKQKDSDEEDLTSSNGLSGNEETTYSRTTPRRGPPHRHHGRHASSSNNYRRVTSTVVVTTLVAFVAYYGYLGYLETRVYTPLPVDKVVLKKGLQVPERFWGSYRPGVYFGMKHRSPKSLLTGLMWLLPSQVRPGEANLRHLCEQGDNLKTYGWREHDGVNFGVQEIVDHNIKIVTSFVKKFGGTHGGDWTSRIQIQPLKTKGLPPSNMRDETVLVYYVALEPGLSGKINPIFSGDEVVGIEGETEELGHFKLRFVVGQGVLKTSFMQTTLDSMTAASSVTLSSMATTSVNDKWFFFLRQPKPEDHRTQAPNYLAFQVHVKGEFAMDVVYESGSISNRQAHLEGVAYTDLLETFRNNFNKKFETTFHLEKKGFNSSLISFAKATMSNLIGGIGYFHGNSKVQSSYNAAPVAYWTAGLYTGVPSRSFFPRGFLWDEGFHLILVNKWNPEISVDIISHWLDLMNTEGWIPREQILGDEALSRVPEEFVVQRNDVANPPTLIMALLDLLNRQREWLLINHKPTLHRMWPRLSAWYHWLNKTQTGEVPSTYRWRGRNGTIARELNPKTLASGLDDYPRASHPTDLERHVDLRCWMAICSKLMGEIADILGYDSTRYMFTNELLTNQELLDSLHWSPSLEGYADYGLHSDKVVLRYPSNTNSRNLNIQPEKIRFVLQPPEYGFVNSYGYVSLFPLILEILQPNSPNLVTIIKKLDNPKLLWTNYGLRSLAANAPAYKARNTEHDPPYWRGPVWININFLTLKSLHHYSNIEGPSKAIAKSIYDRLRLNVINNIASQYYKTGYVWEQYDDTTGEGKGCRPFTGWSALSVLIMAEEF